MARWPKVLHPALQPLLLCIAISCLGAGDASGEQARRANRTVLRADGSGRWTRTGRRALEHQGDDQPWTAQARPYASSMTASQRSNQEWRTFHNVLLRSENELLYFVDDPTQIEQTSKHLPDMNRVLHGQFWNRSSDTQPFKIHVVASTEPAKSDACTRWIEQPALYHSAFSLSHLNFAHAVQDGYVQLVYTLIVSGLFNLTAMKDRGGRLPSSEEANLMILQRSPMFLSAPTTWLLDYLTPDVKVANQMVGACFRTLVIGVDGSARVYTREIAPSHAQRRQDAWLAFREFVFEAAQSTFVQRGWPPLQLFRRGEGGRLRIGWVSRPVKNFQSRAALNEADVIDAMKRRYDADISILTFHSGPEGLGKAVEATHALDILVGFHGAGLINLLWMEAGSLLVQLLPYGWHTSNASFFPNAHLIENVADSAGVRHTVWANTDPQKAFFRHSDFKDRDAWVPHPDESTPLPLDAWSRNGAPAYYQYQDTEVDIDSFLEVMDDAVRTADGNGVRHAPHRHARYL